MDQERTSCNFCNPVGSHCICRAYHTETYGWHMLRRSNSFPQEVSMFSLIALYLAHRRNPVSSRAAGSVVALPRAVANDHGQGFARAA